MANLKASKKDIRRSERARDKNTAAKSALKTYIKKARKAAQDKDQKATAGAVATVNKFLDKAVQKGVVHKNQAARRKSRVAKAANKALSQ
ncbi:MAG: 30S ribosomal protein S20 [Armatimonadetes bacterium]|nr:30S ribosomal protein S20 [Armatimonadota bacterium]